MRDLKRAAAYSMKPNQLDRCGPKDAHLILKEFVSGVGNHTEEEVEELLRRFEVAMPYYLLIATSSRIVDPFDSRVVEAYWIGNELLDCVGEEDIRQVIASDVLNSGWNRQQIALLFSAIKLKQARPHHSLSVLYFFTFPGSKMTLAKEIKDRIDSCRVCSGRVNKVEAEALTVDYQPLVFDASNRPVIGKHIEKKIDRGFLSDVVVGDRIAFHLDYGIEKLDDRRMENLNRYTSLTLDALYGG